MKIPRCMRLVKAGPKEPARIWITGEIGAGGWFSENTVDPKDINDLLETIHAGTPIELIVNSQGGSVGDGLAIYNALSRRRDDITTRIDGYALSIASVIALAGKRIVSPDSSIWMIHDPWSMTVGDAADHRKSADVLDVHAEVLVGIYAERTGKSPKEVRDAMIAEAWFTGAEAVDWGLATEGSDATVALAPLTVHAFRRVPEYVTTGAATAQTVKPKTQPVAAGPKNQNNMREKIIALLKKLNIASDDKLTDEQLLELLPVGARPAQTDPPADVASRAELDAANKRIEIAEARWIKAQLKELAATRPGIDVVAWEPRVIADSTLLEALAKFPQTGAPSVGTGASDQGNPLIEAYKAMDYSKRVDAMSISDRVAAAQARNAHRLVNDSELRNQYRRSGVMAANTIDSALVTDYLHDAVIVAINNKLAPLNSFSTNFTLDPLKPRATIQVPINTASDAVQTNATNFETSGDSTVDNRPITVGHISKSFHLLSTEVQQGSTLARMAGFAAHVFANGISDVWTNVLSAANYGAGTVIGTAANFTSTDLMPIMELAKNYGMKNLILDGGHLAYLLPTDKLSFKIGEQGAYGFDLISEQNRWQGASIIANTVGVICDPQALIVGSGLPLDVPAGQMISSSVIETGIRGLACRAYQWYNTAGRVHWASYDIMFGAGPGDGTAAEVLITA